MRQQDRLAAAVENFRNRGRVAFDASGIADTTVLYRHVEIEAREHTLALEVGLIERAKLGHLIIRRAASPTPRWCSDQLPHGDSCVDHAVRKSPLVVVPGHDAHKISIHHL